MLAIAEFAYNNSQHSSTRISPFQALFGYSPSLPLMLADDVHEHDVPSARERIRKIYAARAVLDCNLAAATVSQKKHYNKKHIPIKFALEEWVMLSSKNIRFRSSKLTPPFIGPF